MDLRSIFGRSSVDFGVILEGVFGVILGSVLSAAINAFNQGRASIKWSSGQFFKFLLKMRSDAI